MFPYEDTKTMSVHLSVCTPRRDVRCHLSFVNISPTLVAVVTILADAVPIIGAIILSINIQVGLNMHLYDDIGNATLSLRGSTSSYIYSLICHGTSLKKPFGHVGTRTCVAGLSQQTCCALDHHTSPKKDASSPELSNTVFSHS